MKYLIVGLGNIGDEYANTRHNIGFMVLDAFAEASNLVFKDERYGAIAEGRVKNKEFILLKPNTYMNLSGNAVRYRANKEKIDVDHIFVVVDDLSLPFGKIRIKGSGSAGGHNGIKSIIAKIIFNINNKLCVFWHNILLLYYYFIIFYPKYKEIKSPNFIKKVNLEIDLIQLNYMITI